MSKQDRPDIGIIRPDKYPVYFRGFKNCYSEKKINKTMLTNTDQGLTSFLDGNQRIILQSVWREKVLVSRTAGELITASTPSSSNYCQLPDTPDSVSSCHIPESPDVVFRSNISFSEISEEKGDFSMSRGHTMCPTIGSSEVLVTGSSELSHLPVPQQDFSFAKYVSGDHRQRLKTDSKTKERWHSSGNGLVSTASKYPDNQLQENENRHTSLRAKLLSLKEIEHATKPQNLHEQSVSKCSDNEGKSEKTKDIHVLNEKVLFEDVPYGPEPPTPKEKEISVKLRKLFDQRRSCQMTDDVVFEEDEDNLLQLRPKNNQANEILFHKRHKAHEKTKHEHESRLQSSDIMTVKSKGSESRRLSRGSNSFVSDDSDASKHERKSESRHKNRDRVRSSDTHDKSRHHNKRRRRKSSESYSSQSSDYLSDSSQLEKRSDSRNSSRYRISNKNLGEDTSGEKSHKYKKRTKHKKERRRRKDSHSSESSDRDDIEENYRSGKRKETSKQRLNEKDVRDQSGVITTNGFKSKGSVDTPAVLSLCTSTNDRGRDRTQKKTNDQEIFSESPSRNRTQSDIVGVLQNIKDEPVDMESFEDFGDSFESPDKIVNIPLPSVIKSEMAIEEEIPDFVPADYELDVKEVDHLKRYTKKCIEDINPNQKLSSDLFKDLQSCIQSLGMKLWESEHYNEIYLWEVNLRLFYMVIFKRVEPDHFLADIENHMLQYPSIEMFFQKYLNIIKVNSEHVIVSPS